MPIIEVKPPEKGKKYTKRVYFGQREQDTEKEDKKEEQEDEHSWCRFDQEV